MAVEGRMGRPPKKAHLKRSERMVLTFTPGERKRINDIIEREGFEGDNDFGREAIREKIERLESQNSVQTGGDDGEKQ